MLTFEFVDSKIIFQAEPMSFIAIKEGYISIGDYGRNPLHIMLKSIFRVTDSCGMWEQTVQLINEQCGMCCGTKLERDIKFCPKCGVCV